MPNGKHIAIYMRVSSAQQKHASQEPDLQRWAAAQDLPVVWYSDTATGTTMQRPEWDRLAAAIASGGLATVAVWQIDRLGRTARGLTALFEELRERRVNLVTLKDGIDLSTPAGRMVANVLASMAQFETELRGERVLAGQAAARASGKTWGGSKPGVPKKLTPAKRLAIQHLKREGQSIVAIAKAVGLSRPTIYAALQRESAVYKALRRKALKFYWGEEQDEWPDKVAEFAEMIRAAEQAAVSMAVAKTKQLKVEHASYTNDWAKATPMMRERLASKAAEMEEEIKIW